MRRGCIATGKIQCDGCHRPLGHGERYLMLGGGESGEQRLCVECSLKLGYASRKEEEGQEALTFFSREDE